MEKITVKSPKYVYIPKSLFAISQKYNLGPSASSILLQLIGYTQQNDIHACIYSYQELAKNTNCSISSINRAIKKLKSKNLIRVVKQKDDLGKRGKNYLINDDIKRVYQLIYVNWDVFNVKPPFTFEK